MSYLRDERLDTGLPSIRTNMRAWEGQNRQRITTLEDRDIAYEERLKYSNGINREHHYPRPPSPGASRRMAQENLSDQLNFYKDEIAKKDRLITQLSSMETPRPVRSFDTTHIEECYSQEKITAIASLKSEMAALQVRCETLQSQHRETQAQLEVRDDKIKELRLHLETVKESESKQIAICNSLRAKISEYDAQAGSLEGAASRSEMAIHSLQHECKNYQERILELEARLKQHLNDRETSEQDRVLFERRYTELVTKISTMCNIEGIAGPGEVSMDLIAARLGDLVSENAMLKGKLGTLREHCQSAELETKASRETIMRLVSEAEREQRSVNKFSADMEGCRMERDRAVEVRRELEHEITMLKERLDASQRAWSATKRELDEREARYASADRENRDRVMMVRNVETTYVGFKETLAQLLSDDFYKIEPSEELIRDRVADLARQMRDKNSHIDMLELKASDLTNRLDLELNNSRDGELRGKRMEADVLELQQTLRKCEGELAAGDAMRDGLRFDKDRYMRFLERIIHAMKMEAITMDLGVESITDAITSRAEQLTRMEADTLVDRKTQIYNLQRKIKSQKEQLESKDLHMELMRKKMGAMEERMTGKTELERDREDEMLRSRKLGKLVERYKRELNECRLEIRDLKARLLESSDIHSRTMAQEREIEDLEVKVGQLETVRQKQASKMNRMKDSMDDTLGHFDEKKAQTQNTIQALSSELRTTKMGLDDITKREKALLDLRQVIARMLGMDVTTLAVPDYEIIARLEKLILANQANVSTAVALDTALVDMEDGFRAGYEDAGRALASVGTRSRTNVKRGTSLRTRPRSASPGRRQKDNRSY